MNNSFEFGSFGSLSDLKRQITLLDRAEEREVLVKKDGESIKTDRYKAIWNANKGTLSCIASNKYKLVQHEQVFLPVVDTLLDLGISCEGRIKEYHDGDVACLELRFKEDKYKVQDDSKEGVQMGIRVVSGFNLWTAISFSLFCHRLVCNNGMRMWKVVEGVGAKRNHIGELDMPQMARNFIKKVADYSDVIQDLIELAIKDTFEWKLAEQLFEVMIQREKYKELILAELRKLNKDKITRYDIYNILTSIASNNKLSLRESAEQYLYAKSQEILTSPMKELVVKYQKKPQIVAQ